MEYGQCNAQGDLALTTRLGAGGFPDHLLMEQSRMVSHTPRCLDIEGSDADSCSILNSQILCPGSSILVACATAEGAKVFCSGPSRSYFIGP